MSNSNLVVNGLDTSANGLTFATLRRRTKPVKRARSRTARDDLASGSLKAQKS
jgi:hypothetical protein